MEMCLIEFTRLSSRKLPKRESVMYHTSDRSIFLASVNTTPLRFDGSDNESRHQSQVEFNTLVLLTWQGLLQA